MKKLFPTVFLILLFWIPAHGNQKNYTEDEFKVAMNKAAEEKFKKLENQGSVDFARELLKKENDLNLKEFELQKQNEVFANNKSDFDKKLVEFKKSQEQLINCLDENEKKYQVTFISYGGSDWENASGKRY